MRWRAEGGFTLLELTVAFGLAVTMVACLAQALSLGLGEWRRCGRGRAREEVAQLLFLLERQLRSLNAALPLEATPEELRFATNASVLALGRGAPVAVRYRRREGGIAYAELPLTDRREVRQRLLRAPEVPLQGVDLRWAFLDAEERWREEWRGRRRPRLVRLRSGGLQLLVRP